MSGARVKKPCGSPLPSLSRIKRAKFAKVFCFFFSKKKISLSHPQQGMGGPAPQA
jgi:hypothetical protein